MALSLRPNFEPVRNLAEAVDQSDDWTGISDPVARRKRQNRLNQRARRRRQAPEKRTPLQLKIHDIRSGHQVPPCDDRLMRRAVSGRAPAVLHELSSIIASTTKPSLSTDHLIHLIQFNVYRAIMTNVVSLRLWHVMACESNGNPQQPPQQHQRQQQQQHLSIFPLPLATAIPPTLQPSQLQLQTPHPPWIDVFPHQGLRDALIKATGLYDEHELCIDMVGSMTSSHLEDRKRSRASDTVQANWDVMKFAESEDGDGDSSISSDYSVDRHGFVCWGDPWRTESWEIEEGFVRKWGWLLRENCEDLLCVTDRWRCLRGEDPFPWERWGIRSASASAS